MAKCENCGNEYLTKECLKCLNKEYMKNVNATYRTDNKLKTKKKSYLVSIIFIAMIGIALTTLYNNFNTNPLLGTWQMKKSMPMIGKMKMTFKKDKAIIMGIVSKVEYEINENNVIVTDKTGTGIIYKIIDKNTISYGMMGMNMKLYRVK